MTESKEKLSSVATPKWLKMIFVVWCGLSAVLLILTLKPYNKAYVTAGHSHYQFTNQSDSAKGYVVDYGGVIDFVSYDDGFAQAEVLIKASKQYKVRFRNKVTGENEVIAYVNGAEVAKLSPSTDRTVKQFSLRKNDYLKIRVTSLNGKKNEVEVKLEVDNGGQQRQIYAVIVLWILIGIWFLYSASGIHLVLPSMLFVVACYNEHLYDPKSWWLPMVGFVAGTVVLSLTRMGISLLGKLGRNINLLFDLAQSILILLCAGFIWNYKRFGYKMDYDSIVAVLQSNVSETIEFAITALGFWFPLILLVVFAIPILLFLVGKKVKPKTVRISHIYLEIVAFIIAFLCIPESKFITEFTSAHAQYYEEIAKFNEVQKRFKNQSNVTANKKEEGETYIFVIGESQSKEHMSVYGYHRPTTPFLDSLNKSGSIALFDKAYSSHTHTIVVLRDALTQSNQYNGLKYTDVPSLINVLNAADFETVWLSNQVMLSNWDNIVSAIASACDTKIYVNKNIGESMRNSPHDEKLLPELENVLSDNGSRNKAIFVHVLGNHGQYNERYPKSFQGIPSRGKADFGNQQDLKVWEAYDNSIAYSDYILQQIHTIIDDAPGNVKLLTYFADHAEDLSDGRGHNSGQFTFRMTQIPMYVWANEGYKKRYPNKWDRIARSTTNTFSNDLFFQMALDVAAIETPLSNDTFNVLHPSYHVDTFKTKEGALVYNSDNNEYTALAKNIDSLKNRSQDSRIGIHRVNSLGKLNEIDIQGITSIELDVKLVGDELVVGHGEENVSSGLSLKEYFAEANMLELNKVWLDVKNLDENNLSIVLDYLKEVDAQYAIKSKLIVETQSTDYNVSLLVQQGFDVSYYLPTSIVKMSDAEQKQLALNIVKQLKYQKLEAISFDAQLYDFVKLNLENNISPNIKYHTWDLGLNVRQGQFLNQLDQKPYYNDTRVETILVRYPSVFDL